MRILFYYSANKRSNALETQISALVELGHEVVLLTTCEEGLFHEAVSHMKVETYANPDGGSGILRYVKQARFLKRFADENNIDVILSHLQGPNFISLLSKKYFGLKSSVINFRHHENRGVNGEVTNRNEVRLDRFINRQAQTLVFPSQNVADRVINAEKIQKSKVRILPYMYEFSHLPQVDEIRVRELKESSLCHLQLIMVSRMVALKQHMLVLKAVHDLIIEGLDIKMWVLDEGPEKNKLMKFVNDHKVDDRIQFIGFTSEVQQYMAAADVLVQPSLTDTSNSAIKEAAMVQLPAIVLRDVGDYDEYIIDGENGWLLNTNCTSEDLKNALRSLYEDPDKCKSAGSALRTTVIERFSRSEDSIHRLNELLIGSQQKKQ